MTYNVILAATAGRVSGVDVFSCNLVRELQRLGVPAHIVRTAPYWTPPDPMPVPADIPVHDLPTQSRLSWPARWRTMQRYLEDRAPCIYIPNYDWRHSCVSPKLSKRVGIVGIVHSDDPQHYEHVARLGSYWNAVVTVSPTVAERTATLDATLAPRLVTIPYGVKVRPALPEQRPKGNGPLNVVYAGRLVQAQKRVLDLPHIVRALVDRRVPIELTVLGGGEEQEWLVRACVELGIQEQVKLLGIRRNDEVLEILAGCDVVLLPSAFEGLPVVLLEAMGQGCVPVVTDIRSGIPELVTDGVNGYRVPVGDISAFADRLATLQRDAVLRQALAAKAYETIRTGGYDVQSMVQSYLALFERVWREADAGAFLRPKGRIRPPKELRAEASWVGVLPGPVRRAGRAGVGLLRRASESAGSREKKT